MAEPSRCKHGIHASVAVIFSKKYKNKTFTKCSSETKRGVKSVFVTSDDGRYLRHRPWTQR